MTDWLAHIGGPSSALAGLDMSMPGDGVEALIGSSYVCIFRLSGLFPVRFM